MIQQNELRLKNWVQTFSPRNEIVQIVDLSTNICKAGEYLNDYENIHPIVLSTEILEKCGFELNRNNELSIEINDIASHLELMSGTGGFYYPSFTQTPQGDEERTVYFNRINSLHQLQNLYYALTGEELTYKQ